MPNTTTNPKITRDSLMTLEAYAKELDELINAFNDEVGLLKAL